MIAGGGRGREGYGAVERSLGVAAADSTLLIVGAHTGDGEGVVDEDGLNGGVVHGGDVQGGGSGEFNAVDSGPLLEEVARSWCSGVVGVEEVFHCSWSVDRAEAAFGSGSFDGDGHVVYVGVEVGREGTVAVGVDGKAGFGASHLVMTIGPVHEVVAFAGLGHDGHRQVELHSSGIADGAPSLSLLLCHHRWSDGKLKAVEVGLEGGVLSQREGLGDRGANHHVARGGPVGELVAIGRCSGEGDAGVFILIGERGRGGDDAAHGGRSLLVGHGQTSGHGVLLHLTYNKVVHIGGGAVLIIATKDNIIGARDSEREFVGVPAYCTFHWNHTI